MGRNYQESAHIDNKYSRKLIRGTVNATVGINSPKRFLQTYGKNLNRIELLRLIEKESKFKLIWYSVFVSFIIVFACIFPSSYLSLIELAVLLVAVDLTSRGKTLGLAISIIECCLYAYISYTSGLIGEVIKNLAIGVPLNIYAMISWINNSKKLKQNNTKYSKSDGADITIKRLSKKNFLLTFVYAFVASIGCYFLLRFGLGQTTSLITSSLVLGSMLISKILNGARYMQSWIFSIIQSFLALIMWLVTIINGGATILELPMIAVTLACISNNIYGYNMWKTLYRRVAVNGGILLNKRKVSINKIIKLRRKFRELYWDKETDINKNV